MALCDAVGCTLKRGGIFGTDSRSVWLKPAVGVNILSASCPLRRLFTCSLAKIWLSMGFH